MEYMYIVVNYLNFTGAAELGGQAGHLPTQIFEKHQQRD